MSTVGRITDLLSGTALDLEVGGNIGVNLTAYDRLGVLDSLDEDLIRVAAYIYAADLAFKRQERELHLRTMQVRIPVTNFHAFHSVHDLVESALGTLSGDNWTIEFVAIPQTSPASHRTWPKKAEATLMFSGGLDSFAGALKLLDQFKSITLVSHITHNRPVEEAQEKLAAAVRKFVARDLTHLQLRVGGRKHDPWVFPEDREDTQRTRSFLFVALSAVAARLEGSRRLVVMAENGQFAVHLPLSEARVSSFSTHTAHPKFLVEMQAILRELFQCPDLELTNPFVHMTKGEVVGLIRPQLHADVKHSTSCWRASRVSGGKTHCGECVPCLCRRVALEVNGIKLPEYDRDLLVENIGNLPPDDLGKRNLVDYCNFISQFAGPHAIVSAQELSYRFPELYDPHLDAKQVVAMYRRSAEEALKVFDQYPQVKALLT